MRFISFEWWRDASHTLCLFNNLSWFWSQRTAFCRSRSSATFGRHTNLANDVIRVEIEIILFAVEMLGNEPLRNIFKLNRMPNLFPLKYFQQSHYCSSECANAHNLFRGGRKKGSAGVWCERRLNWQQWLQQRQQPPNEPTRHMVHWPPTKNRANLHIKCISRARQPDILCV